MIATLPMYDLPWLRAANDRLWAAIAVRLRGAGIAAPPALTRGIDLDEAWRSPGLLLGQSCGYPLMTELRETVQLVATPLYVAAGCEGATHRAAIVVRDDAPAASLAGLGGLRAGVNGPRSNTGMNLLRAVIAPLAGGGRFFSAVTVTGSHARSLAAILSGRVDVAAIDAVTLAHLADRYPRHAARIRIVAWTAATPALPLVASADSDARAIAALRDALAGVSADPGLSGTLATLRIAGFAQLDLAAYGAVLDLESAAVRHGFPVLQ